MNYSSLCKGKKDLNNVAFGSIHNIIQLQYCRFPLCEFSINE